MSKVEHKDQREIIARKLKLGTKCGSCKGLTAKLPGFDAPCTKLGKSRSSASCNAYQPDYLSVNDEMPQFIRDLGKLIKEIPEDLRHIAAYALVNSTELERTSEIILGKKNKLKLGMPIYINLSAPYEDYLNCYFRGFAMAVTRDKKGLICYSKVNDTWVSTMIMMRAGNVLTNSQFRKHTNVLVKKGKINAPKRSLAAFLPTLPLDVRAATYKAPSLHEASKKLLKSGSTQVRTFKSKDKTLDKKMKVTKNKYGHTVELG